MNCSERVPTMLLEEDLTKQIIGAAIEVHRELGPDCSNQFTSSASAMS